MKSEVRRRECSQGPLLRLIATEQRLSIELDRGDSRFLPDNLVCISGCEFRSVGGYIAEWPRILPIISDGTVPTDPPR